MNKHSWLMSQPHVWNRVEGFVWGSEYRPLGEVVVDLPVPQYFPRKERRSNGGAKQSRSFYLVLHCEDFVKKEPQWEGRTWRLLAFRATDYSRWRRRRLTWSRNFMQWRFKSRTAMERRKSRRARWVHKKRQVSICQQKTHQLCHPTGGRKTLFAVPGPYKGHIREELEEELERGASRSLELSKGISKLI